MKVMFLGGVFAKENEQEVLAYARKPVEYSANLFQEKMILAFRREIGENFSVISAPFIGAYPNASSRLRFDGFRNNQSQYEYVPFNNIWGIRNLSRAKHLKKAIRTFIEVNDEEKLIVVYSPHTPFLEAAVYAKQKDSGIRICLVVPDLPQYMNLNTNVSLLYRIGKKVDIFRFNQLTSYVDSFMLLTELMREKVNTGEKPYIVVEGIIEDGVFERNEVQKQQIKEETSLKYVVYTGKMQEKFGVKNLVEAFLMLDNPDYRLILCGTGDLDPYIQTQVKNDRRIVALGQVTPDIAHDWVLKADVLVNPRKNDEVYTRYSFPSKNIEYLASGNPVVAYMLDGMKPVYRDFICCPEDNSTEALAKKICSKLNSSGDCKNFSLYAQQLSGRAVARKILRLHFSLRMVGHDFN